MDIWPRAFAYSTFALTIGLAIVVFTEEFIRLVQVPGTEGYLASIAYGLVYMNFGFVVSKRFTTKTPRLVEVSYLLTAMLLVGPFVWIFIKDLGLTDSGRLIFLMDVVVGAYIGAYFGIRRGEAKREEYFEALKERYKQNDMKRPHDDLSKN